MSVFFIYWLHRVFFAALGLSPVATSGVYSYRSARLLTAVASRYGAQALGARASVVMAQSSLELGFSGCGAQA